jgi:hypothetical protein
MAVPPTQLAKKHQTLFAANPMHLLPYKLFLLRESTKLWRLRLKEPAVAFSLDRMPAHLALRSTWLRCRLQDSPTWTEGHFQLGKSELAKLLIAEGERDGRQIYCPRIAQSSLRLYRQLLLSPNQIRECRFVPILITLESKRLFL